MISSAVMDRMKGWAYGLGFLSVMAGALLSRDACLGGGKRPPPEPPAQTATAAQTAAPASPPPSAAPASTQTFAAPP